MSFLRIQNLKANKTGANITEVIRFLYEWFRFGPEGATLGNFLLTL
jgi:hypothetical protein